MGQTYLFKIFIRYAGLRAGDVNVICKFMQIGMLMSLHPCSRLLVSVRVVTLSQGSPPGSLCHLASSV